MAALIISISSYLSEESVSSHAPRVILFGAIPTIIPIIFEVPIVLADPIVAPEVRTVLVISPFGVLDLVDYSSSFDSDPSEDSLPPVPDLTLVSPFLCSDDLEADSESEPAEQRPVSSPHDTLAPSSEFPLVPIVAPPEIRRHSMTLRRVSYHSSDRHSSPDSSSSSSPLDHSLFRYTPPNTTDADTSTPPRFFHRSLAMTPRHSEAFRGWRSAPLSTLYPPTTSESSLGSSSERSIAPTPTDLLPHRKRFRDLYSPEDSRDEHMEVDIADTEAVVDVGISDGVVSHTEDSVGMRVKITTSDVREDDEEFEAEASAADTREIIVDPLAIGDSYESSRGGIPDLEDTIYDIVHYMLEVRIDRITEIETTQRQLEASQLMASVKKASLVERIGSLRLEYLKVRRDRDDTQRRLRRTMTISRSGMTPEAIKELVNRRMEEALAAYEEAHVANALRAENQSQNGSDGGNGNGGNGNGRNENSRGDRPVAKECTYQDFMKCQSLSFKGTEGVIR
ncbi:hypothetical protein Tco_0290665, partial [Tanacetum coccineum]